METTPTTVAGVDGCPGGWVVVTHRGTNCTGAGRLEHGTIPGSFSVEKTPTLDGLVAAVRCGLVAVAAIDMPIGLLDHTPRTADTEARRYLGPRRASVFATPVRAALDATDHGDACDRSRRVSGKAISLQAFHLLPKIRQLDALIGPADQAGVVEAHPECAFARLAGAPLDDAKATRRGLGTRRRLLEEHFGPSIGDILDSGVAPRNDLVDAAVLIVTARHVLGGTEIRFGGELDATGLRAEIVA